MDLRTAIHATDLYPDVAHTAVTALFRSLGQPRPVELTSDRRLDQSVLVGTGGIHLVFGLAEHHRGFGAGRAQPYVTMGLAGDQLVVPGYSDDGYLVTLCLGFGDGNSEMALYRWPNTNQAAHNALYTLLAEFET